MVDFKVPGVGRIGATNPFFHEPAGQGIGRIDVGGSNRPQGDLSIVVLDKDGNPRQAKDVMSFWSRFWGNIRADDTEIMLGSGLVTNVGVLALANDFGWANPSGAQNNTLDTANWHASGTGATAAAATDITLQTASANGGQTPIAGTQSLVSAANSQKYRTVATISYTGTESVTEWGLFTQSVLSATTGTPFTATSAISGTATGTPYTASSTTVAGEQLFIIVPGTTAVWGLITSNTTSVLSLPAWYKTVDGTAGSTPGSTEAFTIKPIMWDHKVFSSVGVNSGDSIQYTYTLTINSGG